MTRGEKVVAFIERFCLVPEGKLVGKPIRLEPFQRDFILAVYDNPAGTRRAYLSIARKNGKSALIACLILAHLVGPEAKLNSQLVSGARSRDQAAVVYELAAKMVQLSPELTKIVRPVPSGKRLIGLTMNTEFKALAAEGRTAHGKSPILAILDEVGQVKGPRDEFTDAITTAQGAHENPLLIAISTQAPTDGDMFSIWLDDAESSQDPSIVSHVYTAPEGCELDDRAAWAAANPALNVFRSLRDVEEQATQAIRMPSAENTFRVLTLNQRVDANSPFISKSIWQSCGAPVTSDWGDAEVYSGLDLSATSDLTAHVPIAAIDGIWETKPTFWLPGEGLREKARTDRVPYDIWADEGFIRTTPGKAVEYEWVARQLYEFDRTHNWKKCAFDRWNMKHLRPWLLKAGFTEERIDGLFEEFGQGFQSMSPALRDTEAVLLEGKLRHANHPVLAMCAANAVVTTDPAGGRKLNKAKAAGRIDGMVALAMAFGVAPSEVEGPSVYQSRGLIFV
jgi:phage terminase large subunit-like protein